MHKIEVHTCYNSQKWVQKVFKLKKNMYMQVFCYVFSVAFYTEASLWFSLIKISCSYWMLQQLFCNSLVFTIKGVYWIFPKFPCSFYSCLDYAWYIFSIRLTLPISCCAQCICIKWESWPILCSCQLLSGTLYGFIDCILCQYVLKSSKWQNAQLNNFTYIRLVDCDGLGVMMDY